MLSEYEPPKLYTSSEVIAAEWRKLYPGIEIVMTPRSYLRENA